MGNVPNTVKHCLSYEQLLQEHPWLRPWSLEEKVGVVFLVANLPHMLCHMTLPWQRGCTAARTLLTAEALHCLYNWSLLVKSCSAFVCSFPAMTRMLLSNYMQIFL